MKRYLQLAICCGLSVLLMVSCKSSEKVSKDGTSTIDATFSQKEFVEAVSENALTEQCLTAKLKFTASLGGQEASVGGSLKMKRNDVIRIQLVFHGLMEVGRMEFTKDYVLIMDRVNKQYIKGSYDDIDFLRANGINFYTLQALFWNELFQPGKQLPQLDKFSAALQEDGNVLLSLSSGHMDYQWEAERQTAQIHSASITRQKEGSSDGEMKWNYRSFKKFGKKQFPTDQQLNIKAKGKTMKASFQLSSLSNDNSWESRTSVSGKYSKVNAEDIFRKLLSL